MWQLFVYSKWTMIRNWNKWCRVAAFDVWSPVCVMAVLCNMRKKWWIVTTTVYSRFMSMMMPDTQYNITMQNRNMIAVEIQSKNWRLVHQWRESSCWHRHWTICIQTFGIHLMTNCVMWKSPLLKSGGIETWSWKNF